jgi:tetratricopeptide (TPR) repeat protein
VTLSRYQFLFRQVQSRTQSFLLCGLVLVCAGWARADARTAVEQAADLVQQGQLEQAEAKARVALSDADTRAAANSVLGTIRYQQKRFPESVAFFQEAIRLEPRLIGAHLTLGQIYSVQGKSDLAAKMYRQVLALDSSNIPARIFLASLESSTGHYRESLEVARPVQKQLKASLEGVLILSEDYLKTGDRSSAIELAKSWGTFANVPTELSIRFAVLLARGGVFAQAIDILEQAKEDGSPSYDLVFNLAGMYALNNDSEHALENYDLALKIQSDSVPALHQAAIIAEQRGELERALSYWLRAKKLQPQDPEILLGFGRVCLKMDLLEDAEPALTQAASLRPDAAYQYALASAKVGKKQFEAAQGILEKVVEKEPDNSQFQYALGSVLYLEGKLAEAATHLSNSVRLQPQQLASYYYQALIARDQSRDSDAIHILEKLRQQYPDHAPSCELLGELLMSAHRYEEAETNLEKAVQLNPKSVKGNYQLGLLLSRMGKKPEADRQLAIAKSLRTEDEATSRLQLRLLDPDQ